MNYEVQRLKLAPCPHCGEKRQHNICTTLAATHEFFDDIGRKHIHDPNRIMMTLICYKCEDRETHTFKYACSVVHCSEEQAVID
jgi:hypothetical protein